jgi:hypothetical protein
LRGTSRCVIDRDQLGKLAGVLLSIWFDQDRRLGSVYVGVSETTWTSPRMRVTQVIVTIRYAYF